MKRQKLYTVLLRYQDLFFGVYPNGTVPKNVVRVSKLKEAQRNFALNCENLKKGKFKEGVEVFIVRINSKSCPIKLTEDVKWRDGIYYRDIQFCHKKVAHLYKKQNFS